MMKKIICLLALSVSLTACDPEALEDILDNAGLSNEEVVAGLKEALQVGTDTSVSVLNKLDGYYADPIVKILLPQEAQVIYDRLSQIPGGNLLLERTLISINRAAEDAAAQAKPIFWTAITDITISDGLAILNGSDTAATAYLNQKTYQPLFTAFKPSIDQSLGKKLVFNQSAEDIYRSLIDAYNTASLNGILFPRITSNSLSTHVTTKALNGLFIKVAEEEIAIRKDPLARVTSLLEKVFGSK